MAPCHRVYVHDDGTVRFSVAQPKESMLLLRDPAAGEPAAFEKLCDLFDPCTKDGVDLFHYDDLLRKALASIEHTFQERAAASLLSGRGALLPHRCRSAELQGRRFRSRHLDGGERGPLRLTKLGRFGTVGGTTEADRGTP
ncbi:MAG: hypothetical protein HZB55_00095 [Deltaproteobacteria bacterium]|nr:hypothetical protein [Deltaproteobacteria bacterium]